MPFLPMGRSGLHLRAVGRKWLPPTGFGGRSPAGAGHSGGEPPISLGASGALDRRARCRTAPSAALREPHAGCIREGRPRLRLTVPSRCMAAMRRAEHRAQVPRPTSSSGHLDRKSAPVPGQVRLWPTSNAGARGARGARGHGATAFSPTLPMPDAQGPGPPARATTPRPGPGFPGVLAHSPCTHPPVPGAVAGSRRNGQAPIVKVRVVLRGKQEFTRDAAVPFPIRLRGDVPVAGAHSAAVPPQAAKARGAAHLALPLLQHLR